MTQQYVYINKSPKIINDIFISHIKNCFINDNIVEKDFELDNIQNFFTPKKGILKKCTDQSTLLHKSIYSTFDKPNFFKTDFWKSYKELCLEIVDRLKNDTGYFGEWAIQRYPTIRIQFPNNRSVFEFHRDSDYSHPLGEINCFYAINECKILQLFK